MIVELSCIERIVWQEVQRRLQRCVQLMHESGTPSDSDYPGTSNLRRPAVELCCVTTAVFTLCKGLLGGLLTCVSMQGEQHWLAMVCRRSSSSSPRMASPRHQQQDLRSRKQMESQRMPTQLRSVVSIPSQHYCAGSAQVAPALSTASRAMQDSPHMIMIVDHSRPTEIHDSAIC